MWPLADPTVVGAVEYIVAPEDIGPSSWNPRIPLHSRDCRCDSVKGLKMGKSSWIIWMGAKCHQKCPYMRQVEEIDMAEEKQALCPWRWTLE